MMHFRFLQGLYSNSFSLLYLDTLFRDSFLSIEIKVLWAILDLNNILVINL
jgi:hypothetical protein